MGMWDSIKKTTSKIARSVMPNPSEVGEIIQAEQAAKNAVVKKVGGKGTVKPKKAPKAKPATKKKAPAKATKKPTTKKPAKKK